MLEYCGRLAAVVAGDLAKGLATRADGSFDGRAGVVRDGCCRLPNTLWASKHNDNITGGIARAAME